MPVLELIEQRGLFRLTRFMTLAIILCLTVGLLVGVALFGSDLLPNHDSHVSYSTISSELHPTISKDQDGTSSRSSGDVPPFSLPKDLQPYFNDSQNQTVLMNHISGLSSDERQEYLSNLSEIVASAEKNKASVIDVINRYFEDKTSKIEAVKADQTSRLIRQIYIVAGFLSTIFLIALASLILVLLAIERNTRKSYA